VPPQHRHTQKTDIVMVLMAGWRHKKRIPSAISARIRRALASVLGGPKGRRIDASSSADAR